MTTDSCTCTPTLVMREEKEWNQTRDFYGYTVRVNLRVHHGACPLTDEVFGAVAVSHVPEEKPK